MIERLNQDCFCLTLDTHRLQQVLQQALPESIDLFGPQHAHLFSAQPVFISQTHAQRMREVAQAIERVAALDAFRERVLAYAPAAARHDPGNPGVFLGVDFHLEAGRLQLIEINTNPGGALLSALLARAQRACCDEMVKMVPDNAAVDAFESAVLAMFMREWRAAGREQPLRRVAIIDTQPLQQYLYPEFVLYQRLFNRAGIDAVIADPSDLQWTGQALQLRASGQTIDLVYNRLTDFALDAPAQAALRAAWDQDGAVITPHPRAHALYADKRNLVVLSDPKVLRELGADAATVALLSAHVPHTEIVSAENAQQLWARRRSLFFKPWAGFGGRAAYRGDKLTRSVWDRIQQGDYVAQQLALPGKRLIGSVMAPRALKFDLRAYADQGHVQWLSARLYQGQTTNFRTPGGGFAPLFEEPPAMR
jgi:glutathione synthase/RimK-type ligase-like ATP-grasp enzyme